MLKGVLEGGEFVGRTLELSDDAELVKLAYEERIVVSHPLYPQGKPAVHPRTETYVRSGRVDADGRTVFVCVSRGEQSTFVDPNLLPQGRFAVDERPEVAAAQLAIVHGRALEEAAARDAALGAGAEENLALRIARERAGS